MISQPLHYGRFSLVISILFVFHFLDAQYIGINTLNPATSLHVVKTNPSGGPFHASSVAVFESSLSPYLQLSSPTSQASAIVSGNGITSIRSAVFFNPDSSVAIRSGGNVSRLFVNKFGRIGIGTTNPLALVHMRHSAGVQGPVHIDALSIIESNTSSSLQFMNPAGSRAGIVSGTASTTVRSGIYFNADNSLQLNAGGDISRLKITSTGNVGIGTAEPAAKLHINGSFILGEEGGSLNAINKFSVSLNIPSIPANSSITYQVNYAGVTTSAVVYLAPPHLPHGLIIAYVNTDPNIINVRFTNITASAINIAESVYHFSVIQ